MAIDVLTIGFRSLHISWFAKPGVTPSLSRANLLHLDPDSNPGRIEGRRITR